MLRRSNVKTLVAVLLGFCSGFLLYMISAMILVDFANEKEPSIAPLLVIFIGAWILSAYALRKNALSTSKVFTRGALLGAAEWIAVALAGVVMSGRLVADTTPTGADSAAAQAGTAIGGGLVALLTGAVSVGMAVVCLIVFTIAHFAGREMADRTRIASRKCPECAEMVQPDARKCKHCGSPLDPLTSRTA
jgi:hypothetical protein